MALFEELLEGYTIGESEVKQLLRENGYIVKDVSKDPQYYYHCDLIAENPITKVSRTIEVKTDKIIGITGNMFCEFDISGKSGWLKYCDADLLYYIDWLNQILYVMELSKLKQWISNADNLQVRSNTEYKNGEYYHTSTGYLVPIEQLNFISKINL